MRHVLHILPPTTIVIAVGLRIRILLPILVRLRLPYRIRPHVPVGYDVLSTSEVVLECWMPSSERTVLGPGRSKSWSEGMCWFFSLEVEVTRPLGACWSILNTVTLPGTKRNEDIGSFVAHDVFEASPCRAISAVFGPDECLRCSGMFESSTVLEPAFLDTWGLEELRWSASVALGSG